MQPAFNAYNNVSNNNNGSIDIQSNISHNNISSSDVSISSPQQNQNENQLSDIADQLQVKHQLLCAHCNRDCSMDKFNDKLIVDNLISAFISKWYCNECKSKDNKQVFYCPFGCTDKNGPKQWISIKWFTYHLKRYHHDSSKVLDMIGMKLCMDVDCTQVIDNDITYCQLHHQINSFDDNYQQNIFANCKIDENRKHFVCHNGQLFDLNKLMQVYDYSDNISENTLKLVGHALTEALDDLAFIHLIAILCVHVN